MTSTSSITVTDKTLESLATSMFTHTKDEVVKRIEDIIGIPSSEGWYIPSENGKIFLVHFTEDNHTPNCNPLRGVPVHLDYGVLATSFGKTHDAIASSLSLTFEKLTILNGEGEIQGEMNEYLSIQDVDGNHHVFGQTENTHFVIKPNYGGVVIKVIWFEGKLVHFTHKNLNPVNSVWGSSKSFMTLYNEAGGPSAEELFDTSIPFSNTCYDFLVVDKQINVASRQEITRPYIVLLAKREHPIQGIAPELIKEGFPTFETVSELSDGHCNAHGPCVFDPKPMTLEEANHHLRYGYNSSRLQYNDLREGFGEALIIYQVDNAGKVLDVVKVMSPAYKWRDDMREDNPNIYNRFTELSNRPLHLSGYIKFPLFDKEGLKKWIKEHGTLHNLQSVRGVRYSTREDKMKLMWINFVYSLPTHLQEEAIELYDKFAIDSEGAINWVISLEAKHMDLETMVFHHHVKPGTITTIKFIIKKCREYAKQSMDSGKNKDMQTGKRLDERELVRNNIRRWLQKDDGSNLYKIMTAKRIMDKQTN
jgi:hypothetical protein